jgi:serine/threonine protein kinase
VFKAAIFGHPTAIKVFNETGKAWDDKQIAAEVQLLTNVRHEHLNRLYAICFNGPSRCLVLEYMDGGALDDRLANKKKEHPLLEWGERVRVLLHVGRALSHLHMLKPPMIHRDVKCGNVLLTSTKLPDGREKVLAKLADFGTARHTAEIMKKDRESHDFGNGTELMTHASTRNVCGTRPYMPPEYLARGECFVPLASSNPATRTYMYLCYRPHERKDGRLRFRSHHRRAAHWPATAVLPRTD